MQKRLFRSFGLVVVSGLAILVGCGKNAFDDEGEACRDDSECSADEVCQPLPDAKRRTMVAAAPPGMVAPPCMITYVACTDSSSCPADQLCWDTSHVPVPFSGPNCFPPAATCAPKCPTTACLTDEVCEASGECRLVMCDEEGALACPDHWQCDPTQALTEKSVFAVGAVEPDSPNYGHDIQRGCARLRCDEAGGFTCKDDWTCDAANAADASGCVALSCEEIGHCSDDELYICNPTSGQSRLGYTDVHGCSYRNCSEGAECGAGRICDAGAAESDVNGCRNLTCEEGVTCPVSYVCEPASDAANASGCVYVPPVGQGGTGGTSGSGGASTGGSIATGGSGAQGGSVARGGSAGSASGGRSGGAGTSGSNATGSGGSAGSTETVEELGRCVAR